MGPSAKNSTSSQRTDIKTHQNGRHYRKNQNFESRKKPFLLMSQGVLNQKIRFLAHKMRPLAREQTKKHIKMSAIIVKIKILKIGKKSFLLMSQGVLNQKIRFLAQKMRPLAREQTKKHIKMD